MARLPSEDYILAILDEYFPRQGQGLNLGRGDDCAVLAPGGPRAVTCDIFAENSHFRRAYFSPAQVGHKALAVNLSDLASSGARPAAFLLSLTLTGQEDEAWLRAFAQGMSALAKQHGVLLAGGDLSRGTQLNISISAWGDLPPGLPYGLRRGRAEAGDILFLCGTAGLARLGLSLLEASPQPQTTALWPAACAAHLEPLPKVEQGLLLASFALQQGLEERLCLMDLSDGLARDLPRLLGSDPQAPHALGADLRLEAEQLHPEVRRYCSQQGLDPAQFAYAGGEDYALLGSCPPKAWPELATALPQAWRLGEVRPGGIFLNGQQQQHKGFDHFA